MKTVALQKGARDSFRFPLISKGLAVAYKAMANHSFRITSFFFSVFTWIMAFGALPGLQADHHHESKPVFTSPVMDLGVVVRDLDRSAKFYKDVLGCQEVKGFEAPAAFATRIGLVDNQDVKVRVFVFGEGKRQSKLKVMAFPEAQGTKPDQSFIHSTVGFSYLTLFVADMNASLARLKEARVKPLGESPVPLGGGNSILVCRDPDGNFIELIGPMKSE